MIFSKLSRLVLSFPIGFIVAMYSFSGEGNMTQKPSRLQPIGSQKQPNNKNPVQNENAEPLFKTYAEFQDGNRRTSHEAPDPSKHRASVTMQVTY